MDHLAGLCSIARYQGMTPSRPWSRLAVLALALTFWHDHAAAAPRPIIVGACLSTRWAPPPRNGQTKREYYSETITQLKSVAGAIQSKVLGTAMTIKYIILSSGTTFPSPHDCAQASANSDKYDIWLELIYEENETFLFEVSQRAGEDLTVIASNPEPLPDAAKTRALFAELGQRITATQSHTAGLIPIEDVKRPSKGIIFVYDTSGSMYETDPKARNRLEVSRTIGAILEHNAQNALYSMPFAMVVFADAAKVLEGPAGSKWFQTTRDDFARARVVLAPALLGMGRTNIGAAFAEVGQLISSRTDVERWHVIFFTDGVPTVGITDYHQITRAVATALGGKSTLSVIALHDKDPSHTSDAKLTELVRATLDDTGHAGEIINLTAGDDLKDFQSDLERVAFLVEGSTVRDKVELRCTHDREARTARCEVDRNQTHALRFGAARKVTFIADTTDLPNGTCTATLENQGLGATPRTVQLPEGQQTAALTDAAFKITLLRSSGRVSITIEMLDGRLNGDWQIALEMNAASRSKL